MLLEIPLKTVSEANQREFWAAKHKRKKAQQREVNAEWLRAFGRNKVSLPCTVRLTRIGPNALDSDNLAGAFKHVRDEIARLIGVDDGDERLRFEYGQEAIGKRQYAVRIEVVEHKRFALPDIGTLGRPDFEDAPTTAEYMKKIRER